MTDLTTMMLRQSLDAYVNLNKSQAQAVMRMDDEVDRYNEEIIDEIVGRDEDVAEPDRARPVDVLRRAPPGADRRPRHQYRRGRDLPHRRRDRSPPAAGDKARDAPDLTEKGVGDEAACAAGVRVALAPPGAAVRPEKR